MLFLFIVFVLLMMFLVAMSFMALLVGYIFRPFAWLLRPRQGSSSVRRDVKDALYQYDNELGRVRPKQ